jgi:hypothetical protein
MLLLDRLRRLGCLKSNRAMSTVAEWFPVGVAAPAQRERTLGNLVLISQPVDEHSLVALD